MKRGTAETYSVFVRDWWRPAEKHDGNWPNNRVPFAGAPKEYIAEGCTISEAREIAQEYNDSHEPGPMSRKAEFEQD